MSQHFYPVTNLPYEHQQAWQQRHDVNLLLHSARTGALIGATGAAALNLHRLRDGATGWQQLVGDTVKVGLTAGVATAAATAVGRMFTRYPALSLAATFATGTAVMYVLTEQRKEPGHE